MLEQVELPYAGTSGWRGSDASRDRAYKEDKDGTTHKRQYETLAILASLGEHGTTFTELSRSVGWSTHKTAAVLSVLHKAGRLARLKERRNRSSIYVDLRYVNGRESVPHGGKKKYDELLVALKRIRELHKATPDGRSCVECSRIICLGTPNGLGGIQYPCPTVQLLGDHA